MRMVLQLIGRGALMGMIIFGILTLGDALIGRGQPFGLRTGLIGITVGAMSLLLALLMSGLSYELAKRNKAPALRRRLLIGAIYTGVAGMVCGVSSAILWTATWRP